MRIEKRLLELETQRPFTTFKRLSFGRDNKSLGSKEKVIGSTPKEKDTCKEDGSVRQF